MGHDTRFHHDLLDRHLVLQYLDNDFFNRLDLPKDLKISVTVQAICMNQLQQQSPNLYSRVLKI